MYPAIEEIRDCLGLDPDKPFILVEYCYAMGNTLATSRTTEIIRADERMCGGFVGDHAVTAGTSDDGRPIHLYGGDHDEAVHDGNFLCVDGPVSPDRVPHPGPLLELKNVQRPARPRVRPGGGLPTIHNDLSRITDLSQYPRISYEVRCDGVVKLRGPDLVEPRPAAHGRRAALRTEGPAYRGAATCWSPTGLPASTSPRAAGHVLGFGEIALRNAEAPPVHAALADRPDWRDLPAGQAEGT